jgi:hypothetical protein
MSRTTERPLHVWPALESQLGMSAAGYIWRQTLGPEFDTLGCLMTPEERLARTLPRFDGLAREYRVVEHGPNDIVRVGRPGERSVPLTRRDVTVYRVNPPRLAEIVSDAFGITTDFAPVEGLVQTFQIGLYRLVAGFAIPTYLTIQPEVSDYRAVVESLVARTVPDGLLLLTPTSRHHGAAIGRFLAARKGALLSLEDSLRLGATGAWSVTESADRILAEFRAKLLPPTDDGMPLEFFPTPADARWSAVRIKFLDGDRVSVKVGMVTDALTYAQMGMVDRRNAKCTKQWDLLRKFARNHGTITWDRRDADKKIKKQCETLIGDLRSFFRIEGEPIVLTEDHKGWQTVFEIVSD